ncbi:MAG TPA: ABC transporter ATP-binding protein [Nitrospirae bacterium]|nr:ABC transporter ATP-binding protein [Nitrospirota bacterium]
MIELEGIRARQGDFLLSAERVTLKKGDFVAVLGNNGSGKSTFLSVLAGLKNFEGKYLFENREFQEIPTAERHGLISLLPQMTTLNMPFDVFYVVLTGRFIHTNGLSYTDADLEATEQAMKELDIMHLRERQFNELSGGEKQRVLLARTINKDSRVILLDEPLSGIDILHQHDSIKLLKELSRKKLIMVVIHDISLALREFDRFLFFTGGDLSYEARSHEIQEDRLSEIFGVRVKFLRHDKGIFVYTEGR